MLAGLAAGSCGVGASLRSLAASEAITAALLVAWAAGALCLLDRALGPASLYAARLPAAAAASVAANALLSLPAASLAALTLFAPPPGPGEGPSFHPVGILGGLLDLLCSPLAHVAALPPRLPLLVWLLFRLSALLAPFIAAVFGSPASAAAASSSSSPSCGALALAGPPLAVAAACLGPLILLHAALVRLRPAEFALCALAALARRVLWEFTGNRLPPREG